MKKKVLVICYGNACRSQIAEGYLRYYTNEQVEVTSAGIQADRLHPLAVKVMHEDGIDISGQYAKELAPYLTQPFDYIITVCPEAEKTLPHLPAETRHIHVPFPDPTRHEGDVSHRLQLFREVREQIKKFVIKFVGQEFSPSITSAA